MREVVGLGLGVRPGLSVVRVEGVGVVGGEE